MGTGYDIRKGEEVKKRQKGLKKLEILKILKIKVKNFVSTSYWLSHLCHLLSFLMPQFLHV